VQKKLAGFSSQQIAAQAGANWEINGIERIESQP
jgi:hypothetical protein